MFTFLPFKSQNRVLKPRGKVGWHFFPLLTGGSKPHSRFGGGNTG